MIAIENYFSIVLFIVLYKVVPTFESVYEILKCDHSNESYWAVLSCGAVYCAVQSGSDMSDGCRMVLNGVEQGLIVMKHSHTKVLYNKVGWCWISLSEA